METNVNYTSVGAFVIFLLACIILAIIWLSSGFSTTPMVIYQVNMEESVSGINLDSPVEFNGVHVGKVKQITICKSDPRLVELLLRIKKDVPVSKGTRASINMRGLTGITYISLQDKGQDKTPLVAEGGEPYPIIKTSKSLLVRLDESLSELSTSIAQMSKSLGDLLDEQNLKAFKITLGNMQRFSTTLATNADQLDRLLRNAAQASQMLQRQTLPAANQAFTNFGTMSNNLQEISTDLKQNPSILIRGKAPPPLGPGEQ